MGSIAAKNVVKTNLPGEVQLVQGTWVGGGAATNCTRTSTDQGAGITSVNYNAATGKYRITLTEWGQQIAPGSHIEVHRAAGSAPRIVNIVRAAPSVATGGATATIDFEVWDMATPSLVDLTTADTITITLAFSKGKRVV
jgi:hypothetical protein